MTRIMKNINNDELNIDVIRYFTNNDIEYLIYSLNEIDNSGYTKLYASKIIGNKACIISEEEEWNLIKQIIKEVVKSNRDGSKLNIVDIDENNLNDIILQDTRVFKLQGNLVNLLMENKKIVDIKEKNIEQTTTDYEKLYNDSLAKIDDLEKTIEQLNEKIIELNNIVEKIKEIVE